ncbi:MAG: tetratricopeptide repeat protein [Cyanobacteria bacterium P01_G01_bin.19]
MGEIPGKSPQARLFEIKKLGNTTEAIASLKELLQENQTLMSAWLELGLIYRRKGDRNLAFDTFAQAIKIAPKNQKIILELAREQFNLNQLENCRNNLVKLLNINPQNVKGILKLGELERKEQKRDRALQLFQKALEIDSQEIWANIHYAIELKHLGQYEEAKRQLEQALEYAPRNFRVLMELGYLERKLGEPELALQWFTRAKAEASNPNGTINAELCAVEQLRSLGNTEQALATIEPILERFSNNVRAKMIFGTLLKRELKWQQAAELYQEVIDFAPKNIQAYSELATCLNELGQTLEAIHILEQALGFAPRNVTLIRKIASLYRRLQDRTKALEYYQQALSIKPEHLFTNLDVAIELKALSQIEEARQTIHQTLAAHPDNFQALMQMGRLEQKIQPKIALEYFDRAIALYPEKLEPHCAKVDLLFDAENLSAAKKYLTQIYQQHPEEFKVYRYLGIHARKSGQRAKANEWFNKAIEKASNLQQKIEGKLLVIEELRDLGNFDLALEQTEAIIQQYPDLIRPRMVKGSILQKIPDLQTAQQVYEEIIAIDEHHFGVKIELARVYSQSGRVEQAIALLAETQASAKNNLSCLVQLGSLNQAIDNWSEAEKCYRAICQQYPDHHQGYGMLANLLSLQGETDRALAILQQAQEKIPNSVQILLNSIQLQMRRGKLDESYQLLREGWARFPDNIQLQWQLCQYYTQQGEYEQALEVLEPIQTDNQDWLRRTEELKANIYFHQYKYYQAEIHYRQASAISTISIGARNRLATILMLTGRIDEARQQFQQATAELNRKTPPGKVAVPLKSHPAMVTNELRINPPLLRKLQLAQQVQGYDRILEFGSLLTLEPTYLGTALYLSRDLRQQGVFAGIEQNLPQNPSNYPTIPKRIVQFWDDLEPPAEITRVCQSWLDHNPDYEYTRFSLSTAVAFLHEHYDQQVFKAFKNCDQPATQADFFRLAYLNKMGGFYADADDLCRQPLDWLVELHPELVVLQEDFACIGNNFIGCIPGQTMIRTAFYQAVNNLAEYCNEGPWFKTGPGLITSVVASALVPYLTYTDYRMYPRLLVLSQTQLRKQINQHLSLAYKRTEKSWQHSAYHRRIVSVG